ncbi:EFR1 family ferrodoxin [Chitinispirillales bacterium ANBcel5]|uniref:EFR1 family ferrodoxin n=1 Tax=Cellulosispirillum alkaliphilum TaxID=3039283 RepID=UPI002A53764A|nr:EFR1 family ferrodoxin [Chitinispirillales bacterium ANBcel5]
MATQIFYFTGTGNSLHVARELQKRIPDATLVPVIGSLNNDSLKATAETVGFVFPIYLMGLPAPMVEFIERFDSTPANYLFAFATRGGTFHYADVMLAKMLKRRGKKLNAFFIATMVKNTPCGVAPKYLPGYKKMVERWPEAITNSQVKKLELPLQQKLDEVSNCIKNKSRWFDERSILRTILKRMTSMILPSAKAMKTTIPYFADSTCTSCAMCRKVCPSGKVDMGGNCPVWRKDKPCYLCFACFNSCPVQAILIRNRYEIKEGRYIHPKVSVKEIGAQKKPGEK